MYWSEMYCHKINLRTQLSSSQSLCNVNTSEINCENPINFFFFNWYYIEYIGEDLNVLESLLSLNFRPPLLNPRSDQIRSDPEQTDGRWSGLFFQRCPIISSVGGNGLALRSLLSINPFRPLCSMSGSSSFFFVSLRFIYSISSTFFF